ncbi:hypothetical protein ACH4GK_32075 [Streptomyces rimosus]|uniref:hypothetical protein n=1 Tax=Streptomyces rimosus TaxID=1927 RepID=UPI0004C9B72E|nr:hypothetical protein [Streptomyces rimosus]
MNTSTRTRLFGPDRQRVGYAEQEWAVWILGIDDIHPHDSLAEALEDAAAHNACFADLRLQDPSQYTPVLHAVVLHHGYAWNRAVEHQHSTDCGHPDCIPCSFDRAVPKAAGQ